LSGTGTMKTPPRGGVFICWGTSQTG
jgi:hypothetical protein